jgi:HK97 family phage portal protein
VSNKAGAFQHLLFQWFGVQRKSLPETGPVSASPTPGETGPNLVSMKHDVEDLLDAFMQSGSPSIESKGFDWNHYSQVTEGSINGMYQGEFQTMPNLRTLKGLYIRENWVGIGVDAIARQFLKARFIIKKQVDDTEVLVIKRGPSIDLLNKLDSRIFFDLVADLILTGQAYLWTRPDGAGAMMLPAERVEPQYGMNSEGRPGVVSYEFSKDPIKGQKNSVLLPVAEVTHIRMPNPFSNLYGLPMLVTAAMPILIDRYGKEYVISFFLRGGTTAGICETTASSADQITRLLKTIQSAFSTRRNMHSDKILPSGVTWKTRGLSFSEIMFDVLQDKNAKQILARLGVPPVCAGMTESVNYANAEAQLEEFHRQTILPIAHLFCTGLQRGSFGAQFGIQEDGNQLQIDFSDNRYVNEFGKKLEEDAKLGPIITVNERRQRLGIPPLPAGDARGELLASELTKPVGTAPTFFALPQPMTSDLSDPNQATTETTSEEDSKGIVLSARSSFKAAADNRERAIPDSVKQLFSREFGAWEQIVLDNVESKEVALTKIEKRGKGFAKDYSDAVIDYVMQAYDAQMQEAVKKGSRPASTKAPKPGRGTQTEADRLANLESLRERSKRLLAGKVENIEHARFVGYSKSEMTRVYNQIQNDMDEGKNLDDVASGIRTKFGEFYEGQATTIMRTEYGTAMAESQSQFAADLGSQCNSIRKTWLSINDTHTRDSHVAADNIEIEGESDFVMDAKFSSVDGNAPDLRYPKEEGGAAEEIINCRCQISYEPVEWKED